MMYLTMFSNAFIALLFAVLGVMYFLKGIKFYFKLTPYSSTRQVLATGTLQGIAVATFVVAGIALYYLFSDTYALALMAI